jgi:hypothetical protein
MAPVGGFGAIPEVARVAGNLLELRHKADDYDHEYVCDALEANLAIVGLFARNAPPVTARCSLPSGA